jgi:hypothetical protein
MYHYESRRTNTVVQEPSSPVASSCSMMPAASKVILISSTAEDQRLKFEVRKTEMITSEFATTALAGLHILASMQNAEQHTKKDLGAGHINDNSGRGKSFTSAGPAPLPVTGSILDDPDLLWTDDTWDEERVNEAVNRINSQGGCISAFWRNKYIREAGKFWHEFYKRNKDNFYKDRHYLHVVFPELLDPPAVDSSDGCLHLLEVGCGVGNAILPLLDVNPHIRIHAIDFASSAIQILRSNPACNPPSSSLSSRLSQTPLCQPRVLADVCNVVADPLPSHVTDPAIGGMDVVLCMFVLSAIAPEVRYIDRGLLIR